MIEKHFPGLMKLLKGEPKIPITVEALDPRGSSWKARAIYNGKVYSYKHYNKNAAVRTVREAVKKVKDTEKALKEKHFV